MARVVKKGLLVLMLFAVVWLAVIIWWQESRTLPTGVDEVPAAAAASVTVGGVVSCVVYCSSTQSTVVFGEIGLSGEVRAVSQTEQRLKEAGKLGFERALMPPLRGRRPARPELSQTEIGTVTDLVALFDTRPASRRSPTDRR